MSQTIQIAGATYPDVPSILVPKQGGGSAVFADPSPTTASAPDVLAGKVFLDQNGSVTAGTGSGGGGGGNEDAIIERSTLNLVNNTASLVGSYAFYSNQSLITVSAAAVKILSLNCFYMCQKLQTVSFPEVSWIQNNAFFSCTELTAAVFPKAASSLGGSAFSRCRNLSLADFPKISSIGSGAFFNCVNLTSVSFPEATFIYASAFIGCSALPSVSFPKVKTVGSSAFSSCWALHTARFDVASQLFSAAFASCYNLISLYLLSSAVVKLGNSAVFNSTPIGGYTASAGQFGSVFVPSSLVSAYKAASVWSTYYSSRIVGLTDAQIEALG